MLHREYIRTSELSRRVGVIGAGRGEQVAELAKRLWSKEKLCNPWTLQQQSRNFTEKVADRINTVDQHRIPCSSDPRARTLTWTGANKISTYR